MTSSGATWAPNTISYTGNNRTHMIRIPDPGRFELRLMDGATNPYLCQAAVLAAGLDGMANKTDPGKRLDINMYEVRRNSDLAKMNVKRLPLNLLDALRQTEKSGLLRSAWGDETVDAYIKMKAREWNEYNRHLTQWERDMTLDC